MLYYSELQNRPIYGPNGQVLARLQDLIFTTANEPYVTKIVLKDNGQKWMAPVSVLRLVSDRLVIQLHDQVPVKLEENELYVRKNILDKQVIDISGNKIVRVNDIVIGTKPKWLVVGVDISLFGIIRWFGLEDVTLNILKHFNLNPIPKFVSWVEIHPLELARGKVVVKSEQKKLLKLLPEDLADHLEMTNIANIDKTIAVLPREYAAEVIANLNLNLQNALFDRFTPEKAASILSLVDPDDIVDLLLTLPKTTSTKIISLLPDDLAREVNYLLKMPKTAIGERITSEYLAVTSETTAKDILKLIRRETSDYSSLSYVYVLNKQRQLVGVVNLHELVLANPEAQVYKFMTQNLIAAHLQTPENIVLKKLFKYNLHALPVLNKQKKMLGIVTIDDLTDSIVQKAGL